MSICVKRKKDLSKNTFLSVRFQKRHCPQKVDQSQRSHEIHAHYLLISVHLNCVASEDDRYLCKNIYWCHLLLRDFVVVVVVVVAYLHKWCQVIIGLGNGLAPNGLPGPIPQFRDNLFKTHGYFAIRQNETNISSSTIYLKTNKITNTTRTQILHRVYTHHIYILQNRSSKLGQTDDIRLPASSPFTSSGDRALTKRSTESGKLYFASCGRHRLGPTLAA